VKNNLRLVLDNSVTRQLETDWIEQEVELGRNILTRFLASLSSTGLRDKYRVRVEAGRVVGTSEIYVAHQGLEEIALDSYNIGGPSTTWQPRKVDPEFEARLLVKLMEHFGADADEAGKQLAESGAAEVTRVKDQLILPPQDLDSAWRRIGIELDRAGVVIEDRDRTAGIYYVRFADDGASGKRGLFGFLGGDETLEERSQPKADRFQVLVKTVAEGVSVSVRDVAGDPDRSPHALRLLDRIHAQLR
jgi:outer membrane protein assembly factor BamC